MTKVKVQIADVEEGYYFSHGIKIFKHAKPVRIKNSWSYGFIVETGQEIFNPDTIVEALEEKDSEGYTVFNPIK